MTLALSRLLTLLGCGLLIGLLEVPLQWISELGFQLQALWPMGTARSWPLALVALPLLGTPLFLALAWGPLATGRGGGLGGLLALQHSDLPSSQRQRALASLTPSVQLTRLPLLLLTHVSGLTLGIESPSAALGATVLLALRSRLAPLAAFSPALLAAIGGGAGLGAAFRSPLLGVTYALEELSATKGISLVLPTLALAGIGTLVGTDLGQPARLQTFLIGGLRPQLWPWALLVTAACALVGVAFVRLLIPLADQLGQRLRSRLWPTALALGGGLALLAVVSGGLSLNDGSLSLGPALTGRADTPWWAALPRLLASLFSIALGAPGGLMHDTMTLGAVVVAPWVQGLSAPDQAALIAIGAAALFSGASRTPLFCALFVFTLQGNPELLSLLLLASALATGLSRVLSPLSWSEHQSEAYLGA
ncbi:chloride channel protein [Cyanobium sp. Morenito 9A2]|uniref:chloride channel protein n=1 Tax=Cyanobium sp. Morenito 9A2 TaxID=2823718 RepID=UPI0020CFC1F7|nr:chloride channel protein [Cyanobium sp. Morenito 9A2]MCP9848900.1 chloride channel protein [Cyanobium sp. Morenito 9A2]